MVSTFSKQAFFFFGGEIDKIEKYVEKQLRRGLLIQYLQWEHKHVKETDIQVPLKEKQLATLQFLEETKGKSGTGRPVTTPETWLLFTKK